MKQGYIYLFISVGACTKVKSSVYMTSEESHVLSFSSRLLRHTLGVQTDFHRMKLFSQIQGILEIPGQITPELSEIANISQENLKSLFLCKLFK